MAGGFLAYLLGLIVSVFAFRKARQQIRKAHYAVAAACVATTVLAGGYSLYHMPVETASAEFTPTDPPNTPMGDAKGIYPGRVAWVHDPNATNWNGSDSYWWDDTHTSQTVVDGMMSNAVRWLTGASTDSVAWDRLFRHFNQTHGQGDIGYQAGQTIAIKINLNNSWSQADSDNEIDASPQTVRTMLRQLVNQAGVPQASITVYDAIRHMPDHIYNPCHAEFPGVRFVDQNGGNGRIGNEFVSGVLRFSNGLIGPWASDLARCLVDADYVINLAILKRHAWCAPLTVCGKNHLGSISGPGDLHDYILGSTLVDYDAQVDLLGHEDIGGKTVLFMLDGLYGSRDVVSIGSPWSMSPFNDDWPSSLFVSQDPIAIDSVAMDFIRTEMFYEMWPNSDRYLHEGALANDPPSATFYDPENDGTRLSSLGVHEHWNNATNKQYTSNLGTGEGIGLISTNPGVNVLPSVSISSPTNGAILAAGDITIEATASDTDGTVAKVEFFDSTAGKLGQDATAPFAYTWPGVPVGNHTVQARAVDDGGATRWSATVSFSTAQRGDMNADGDIDSLDVPIFVNVLLGFDVLPLHQALVDLDESGTADGTDIQLFVNALLET